MEREGKKAPKRSPSVSVGCPRSAEPGTTARIHKQQTPRLCSPARRARLRCCPRGKLQYPISILWSPRRKTLGYLERKQPPGPHTQPDLVSAFFTSLSSVGTGGFYLTCPHGLRSQPKRCAHVPSLPRETGKKGERNGASLSSSPVRDPPPLRG